MDPAIGYTGHTTKPKSGEVMSAERGWIGKPSPAMEQMREQWIAHHRDRGHEPHAAPTVENPEQWNCKCDPDAAWTSVWRILTLEQIKKKFAHLGAKRTKRQV